MDNYKIDPKKQFSKRLARWTAVFWFLYMTWLSTIMMLEPAAALYCMYMGIIVSAVMVLNVYSYTKNSIAEKMIFGLLNKTRLELSFKTAGNPSSHHASEDSGDEESEDEESEGESNG